MRTLLRWIGILILMAILVGSVVAYIARFNDGPLGPFPGGPLVAGELKSPQNKDWTRFADETEAELALVEPPRSRTVWLLVYRSKLYIPCGFPNVRWLKQWPHEVLKDDRVVLRIGGTRYALRANKVEDPELFDALTEIAQGKYGVGGAGPGDPEQVWYFRLDAR